MKLHITKLLFPGDLEDERVVMRADAAVNLGEFVILAAKRSGDGIVPVVRGAYWFPDVVIAGGELVVLYSKPGNDRRKLVAGRARSNFFYWGRDTARWGTGDFVPVLAYAPEWEAFMPS